MRGYGVSPVQIALRDLADTVGQGFTNQSNQALKQEQFGLQKALTMHGLERQEKMDQLQAPGLKLAAEKANVELADMNAPLTVGGMFPDVNALQFATNVSKGSKKSPVEDLADVFGASIDTKEGSQTRGMFIKADGTPVLKKDLRANADKVSAVLMAHTDPYHVYNDQLSRQYEAVKTNPELMKSPEFQKNMKNTLAWLDKQELQLDTLKKQRQFLTAFEGQGPVFEKNIARIDKQIDKIEGTMAKSAEEAREQAFRLKLQDRELAVKKEIAEMGETREDRRAAIASMGKRVDALRDQNKEIEKTIRTYEANKALATDEEKKALDDKINELRGEVKLNLSEINTIAKELTGGEKAKGTQRDVKPGEVYVVDEGVGKSGKRYARYSDGSVKEIPEKKAGAEPTEAEKAAAKKRAEDKVVAAGRTKGTSAEKPPQSQVPEISGEGLPRSLEDYYTEPSGRRTTPAPKESSEPWNIPAPTTLIKKGLGAIQSKMEVSQETQAEAQAAIDRKRGGLAEASERAQEPPKSKAKEEEYRGRVIEAKTQSGQKITARVRGGKYEVYEPKTKTWRKATPNERNLIKAQES